MNPPGLIGGLVAQEARSKPRREEDRRVYEAIQTDLTKLRGVRAMARAAEVGQGPPMLLRGWAA